MAVLVLSAFLAPTLALADDSTVAIDYNSDTGIHSVTTDDGSTIILYCMNNQYHWPHKTPSITDVPSYTLGYLTVDDFKADGKTDEEAQADYEACMEKLLAVLYAGYPYNGLGMYEIGSVHNITEQEFDEKLDAPAMLRSDFPYSVGDTTFTYQDYVQGNTENLDKIVAFLKEVGELYTTGGTTASGLTSTQIMSTDFYNAAICMYYASADYTPLQNWDASHGSGYYVTESQAYWGTQYAIWVVLDQYGIEGNTLTETSPEVTNYPLAGRLVNGVDTSAILRTEPVADQVGISGDARFAYDAAAGVWRTGELKISEGAKYNGHYALTLPDGMVAVDGAGDVLDASDLRAEQGFYLQTQSEPTTQVTLSATTSLKWVRDLRQYSPTALASDGVSFQHMIGALIGTKAITATLDIQPASESSLSVTKKVTGSADPDATYAFTVTLGDDTINGQYGDMEFVDGVATFALSAGETKTARHLPTGVSYTVVEDAADEDSDADGADDAESADAESTDAESTGAGYTTTWRNDTGTIADGQTAEAVCTNAYPSPSKPTDGTDDTGGTSDSPADKTVKPAQASKALPQTGDATSSMAAAGILAACAAIAAGIALRRRA